MKMKNRLTYSRREAMRGVLFIAPWLIGFIFLFVRPFVTAIVFSFNNVDLSNGFIDLTGMGFKNYTDAFTEDTKFMVLLTQALSKMVYQVPLVVFFSLFIAVVLNQKFASRGFFRLVFFLPTIISSGVVLGIINGDTLYNAMQVGEKTTYMLQTVSVQDILRQSGVSETIITYVGSILDSLLELFWYSGIQIVIFLSGLQGISPTLREAAHIDGASAWDFFWLITFPMISPLLLTNTVFTIISTFTDYNNVVISYISEIASKMELGFSSAMSMVYFLITFVIIIVVYFFLNRKVFYRNT
ncbi:MAG: sugar ABC transporter permease [Clostridia bacterium]|nr:sugar ABC transporter permease [Clostridia bacterium]